MSEAEKRKREEYRKNRSRCITCFIAIIALISIMTALFFGVYSHMKKNTYITYTESSDTGYKVFYEENEYFPNGTTEGQGYISSLVTGINASFAYKLHMESPDIEYKYSYTVDVKTVINDKDGNVLWSPVDTYKQSPLLIQKGENELNIKNSISIPYRQYYETANDFVTKLGLKDTKAELVATMRVNVLSTCKDFEGEGTSGSYFTSMTIPLLKPTFSISVTESVGEAEKKILACDKGDLRVLFGRLTQIGVGLDLLAILLFLLFVYLTRNTDINYTIKVKRIVSSYKSYIQKIRGDFNAEGYQPLLVDTFREMLEIRDTIQSPILMSENEDCTCTQFIIPTSTKLLYVFEIKVDNYDEIYAVAEEEIYIPVEEPVVEEPIAEVIEEPVVEEPEIEATEEPAVEAVDEPVAVVVEETEEDSDELTEEELAALGFDSSMFIKYDYSFEARLALSDEETRGYYSEIVAFVKSYGAKLARSWKRERIYFGRQTFANLVFRGKRLSIALALDPVGRDEKYGFTDMSESGKYKKTPALMKITSQRKKKYAIELLRELFTAAGLDDKQLGIAPEYVPYRTRLLLIKQKLIKTENVADIEAAELLIVEEPKMEPIIAEEPVVEEPIIEVEGAELLDMSDVHVDKKDIEEAIAAPDVILEEIEFVEESDPIEAVPEEEEGVEVIGVVWPERAHRNKIYRYDPNGESLHEGDIVLAPSRDVARNKDVVRKVAVAHSNHKVPAETLKHPLKKIIGVVKRRAEAMLTPSDAKIQNMLRSEKGKK